MKEDRRKQRTRKQLQDALVALILEKGYEAVTVQDITDYANLGRATFYLHYRDKEDLLLSSLHEVFDDLKERYGLPSKTSFLDEEMPMRMLPFQHALENRDLYRVMLLSEQGTAAILKGIREYLAEGIQARLAVVLTSENPPVPLELTANYLAGAMLSLISWWLEHDTPYTPEYMAEIFRRLSRPTLASLLVEEK
jgi:AcrR family transcriptional regulator